MAQIFTCNVNQVGPVADASDASETPSPTIYLNLTDVAGTFDHTWFYAANNAKREMLATALAAISTQSQIRAALDIPAGQDVTPHPQCYRLYIVAS
jgi:hypothetical protein